MTELVTCMTSGQVGQLFLGFCARYKNKVVQVVQTGKTFVFRLFSNDLLDNYVDMLKWKLSKKPDLDNLG